METRISFAAKSLACADLNCSQIGQFRVTSLTIHNSHTSHETPDETSSKNETKNMNIVWQALMKKSLARYTIQSARSRVIATVMSHLPSTVEAFKAKANVTR